MKFFTYLCFIAFITGSFSSNAQLLIRDTSTGTSKEISFGAVIYYTLHSDSSLGVELQKDKGIITTTGDSTIVLASGLEIPVSDLKYLEIESKKLTKWKAIMSPVLIAGIGLLAKGTTMAISEGTESKNKEWVPLYAGSGLVVTGLSGIPFWLKNKSYDLTKDNYEIILP